MINELSDIWEIDGKSMPTPQTYSVSMEDLEISAERTADGILHRQRARQGVRKVSFGYTAITQDAYSRLLKMLKPEFIDLQYLDPERGISTIECYCSTKGGELYNAYMYDGLWRNVTFNCIER